VIVLARARVIRVYRSVTGDAWAAR
jgi:hypothetical protein